MSGLVDHILHVSLVKRAVPLLVALFAAKLVRLENVALRKILVRTSFMLLIRDVAFVVCLVSMIRQLMLLHVLKRIIAYRVNAREYQFVICLKVWQDCR